MRLRVVSIDWGSRFTALLETASNPHRALKRVGVFFASKARQAFSSQGRPPESWPERAVPNVPGILQDFHGGGAKPKSRRFDARPAVRDTGLLQRSIKDEMTGPLEVVVGVSGDAHEYADKQQFGGESETLPVTEEFQEWLWTWLRSSEGSKWKKDLGYLLNRKFTGETLTWNVRPRPFLVILEQDLDDVAELAEIEIINQAVEEGG